MKGAADRKVGIPDYINLGLSMTLPKMMSGCRGLVPGVREIYFKARAFARLS